MSDPTNTGQRKPLSSSSSHASGTSARQISVQPDEAPNAMMSMAAQDDVGPPTPHSGGEADLESNPQVEADRELETETDAELEAGSEAEPDNELSQWQAAGDEAATEQPEAANTAHDFGEPAAETHAQDAQSVAPHHSEHFEETEAGSEDQPISAASVGSDDEAQDEVSALTDGAAQSPATDELAYTADAVAHLDTSPPRTPADEDAAPLSPLMGSVIPDVTSELRDAARQTIADNEARQEKALALFEQVSRRFTAALEEAGVDAARVTFKVMEFAQASLKNNLELAKSYTAARSVPDVFGLHAAYIARQFELLNAQAEELREITAKFALRSTAALTPPTDPTGKSLDD